MVADRTNIDNDLIETMGCLTPYSHSYACSNSLVNL